MVKISGVSASIPEEMLELFFESSKRSGGGDIRNIDMFRLVEAAIITFEESEGMFQIWKAPQYLTEDKANFF